MKKYLINSSDFLFETQSFLNKNRVNTIIIGILIIFLVNTVLYFLTDNVELEKKQSRDKTTGFSHDKAQHFFYFYYYTGAFPLATLNDKVEYSKDAALHEINSNGKDLIMEYKHWSRLGENLRIIAYFPNAIIRGSPENPSLKLFNTLIFVIALILTLIAFSRIGKPLLGILLVTLVNITPFFIYEIYQNQNILALLGSVFLIILALNVKFIFSEKSSVFSLVFISILSGVIVGLSSEIRGETLIIIGSAILIYLFSNSIKNIYKVIPIILVVLSLNLTKKIINNYFNNNFESTYELVKKNKGHVYDGKRINGHKFWHPMFCGLGDFDTKYGYEWNDKVAYNYALPILKEKYNINYDYKKGDLHFNEYYDKDSLYYVKFDEVDEYEEIMKTKVLGDIKSNPFWYINILFKRLVSILTNTLPFSYLGWVSILLILALIRIKQWHYIKLIIISLPLSFTPFVIYSANGATYNSFFPILSLSIIIYLLFLFYIKKIKTQ